MTEGIFPFIGIYLSWYIVIDSSNSHLQIYLLLSIVFQDFKIFSFTFGENIAGSAQADKEKALDAMNRVGLKNLMKKMPDGLDAFVNRDFSDTGITVSGGEAQKLAMARAIYKDAPFVILDEPTAALDPLAENEIYAGFHEMIGDKTTLFISHRLSACCFAQLILVFARSYSREVMKNW